MAPLKVSVPAPVLVNAPEVAVLAPEIVRVVPKVVTSIVAILLVFIVKLRSVEAVAPVYCKLPPSNTKLVATFVAEPKLPELTLPSPIVATLKIPAEIVVTPL